ncbi:GNAT family N-acetyltransferase [Streptomyces phaeoluteigriseus]|uniref:GNAT family N-acetyltransferase n=1 Tax=Streptomyces phaeoluteigriseus TaxID=114686 RepID=UPI0009A23EC5|nr:GNAT family N-acetyltransferase [Streptomyces phaeoluteigriseus]
MTTESTRHEQVIRAYGPGQVPPLVDTVADIWADAHPELVDNPGAQAMGLSVPALRQQITGHLKHPGFTLTVAYADGTAVGFGYAFPCSADYWFGPALADHVPQAARHQRLMGLCELAVRPPWQSHGIGRRLHHALLDQRRRRVGTREQPARQARSTAGRSQSVAPAGSIAFRTPDQES